MKNEVNKTVNTSTKVNLLGLSNKFGAFSYILFVIACFLPFLTVEIWGETAWISASEVINFSFVFVMFIGVILCLTGAPPWLTKGLAITAIVYFCYACFSAYSEAKEAFDAMSAQINDMGSFFNSMGLHSSPDIQSSALSELINKLAVGFWLMLTSFIMLTLFVFKSYTESALWLPVKLKLINMLNKAAVKTQHN